MALKLLDSSGKTRRKDNLSRAQVAVGVVFGNLYKNHLHDPNLYTVIPLSNEANDAGEYNPVGLGRETIRELRKFLEEADPPYIITTGGNIDRQGGATSGVSTRCLPTERLVSELEDWITNNEVESEDTNGRENLQAHTPPITRTTLENLDPLGITLGSFFTIASIPLIQMREKKVRGKKKNIPTPDTDEAMEMANRLTRFNDFLDDHWIDLCVPDVDFHLAFENQNTADTEYFERDQETRVADLDHGRRLHRVFNNGTFEDGGRFYGGWWQQVRSGYRKFLTINWHSTSEVDYSGMHPTMLYAWEGLEMPEDPYLLHGLPDEYEKVAKVTFLKMINATKRMQDDVTDLLPDEWDFQRLQEALEEKHQPIAHYLKSGIGVKLQKIDSEIAEAVMLRLMDEDGQLVLPVHDSFVVRSGHEDRLKEVMLDAYASRMGTSIGLKTASNWLHEIIGPMDVDLHNHEVIDLSDTYTKLVHHPDYARFKKRRTEFLERKREEWGQTRHWFNG